MSSLRMSTPLFMYTVVNYFPTIFFRDIEKMSSLRISTPLFMYTVVNYFPTISFRDIEKMSQQQQQARLGMYPPAHMRGSAENLVEKVWIRVNQIFKAPFLESEVYWPQLVIWYDVN